MTTEQRFYYELGRADVLAEQSRLLLLGLEPKPTIWDKLDNFIKKLATKTK